MIASYRVGLRSDVSVANHAEALRVRLVRSNLAYARRMAKRIAVLAKARYGTTRDMAVLRSMAKLYQVKAEAVEFTVKLACELM